MKTKISKSKFKAHALEFSRQVEPSDDEVIITEHGHPRLIVRKHAVPSRQSTPDRLKGSTLHYDTPFDSVAEEDWEAPT